MTRIITCLLIFIAFSSNAQQRDIELKEKNKIELEGFKNPFNLKKGLSWIVLTPIDMQSLDKNKYTILGTDTVYDKTSKSKIVTVNIKLFNIEFKHSNGFYLNDVPAKISYSIPSKQFDSLTYFGTDIFNNAYGDVSIDSSFNSNFPFVLKLSDLLAVPPKINSSISIKNPSTKPKATASPSKVNMPSSVTHLVLPNIDIIRIVPCNLDHSTSYIKSELRKILAKIPNIKIEEETNVPPPKDAVERVDYGITIRYFESLTQNDSENLRSEIEKAIPTTVITFDMQARYTTPPIKNYIEIWIK
ncbi:hypothetical protein N9D46_00870 [Chitinophagales bacterium]|nr:hypothetical protein [Chitinophagales bacterium]